MKLTDVIQHPQEAVDKIAELTARNAELTEALTHERDELMSLYVELSDMEKENKYFNSAPGHVQQMTYRVQSVLAKGVLK